MNSKVTSQEVINVEDNNVNHKIQRNFPISFKLKVIEWYHKNSKNKSATALHFESKKITRQNVQQWVKAEERLKQDLGDKTVSTISRKRIRKERVSYFPIIERKVYEWFQQKRNKREVVTTDGLISKALEVFGRTKLEGQVFKGSTDWLKGFLSRNRLSSRKVTSVGQKVPEDAKPISQLFFERVDQFRSQQKYNNYVIYNMDEMPVYFDSPYESTYDEIGSKNVPMKTTGSEKIRFTLILCASNDGQKCMPSIIFKGLKKVPKNQKFPKIHIMVSNKGSMTTDLLNKWKTEVWGKKPGSIFANTHMKRRNGPKYRTLLIMDSATSHRDKNFKKSMGIHYDTKIEIIPGGMTPLIQPADVCCNKSVKSSIKKQWSQWISDPKSPTELTKSGRLKRPSYALVAEWCLKAWNELPTDAIINSFIYCNSGIQRDDTRLHTRLNQILSELITDLPEAEEHSEMTDNVSIEEEEEEEIVNALESIQID